MLIALIESTQTIPNLITIMKVAAVHPKRVIFNLTVRVSKELKRAVADGNSALQPALHLIIEQILRYLLIVEILVLLLVDKDYPGKVVDLIAILSQYMVRLLSL